MGHEVPLVLLDGGEGDVSALRRPVAAARVALEVHGWLGGRRLGHTVARAALVAVFAGSVRRAGDLGEPVCGCSNRQGGGWERCLGFNRS